MVVGGVSSVPFMSKEGVLKKSLEDHSGEKGQGSSYTWMMFWSIGDLALQPILPKKAFYAESRAVSPPGIDT